MQNIILTEQDIINTYNKRQQEQCRLYYQHKKIKQENPTFGYKRIAKMMGQKIGKTRWWHQGKHKPTPVQAAEWLTEKGLLPLTTEHHKLPLIARILGATIGDGGIFENLNGVYLSSSELNATDMFFYDVLEVFGKEIEQNTRLNEGGEYGHSWCRWSTSRNVIRFFIALGTPLGKKKEIELHAPQWVFTRREVADEFFGAFLGGEIGIPKIHIDRRSLDACAIGITSTPALEQNRHDFLNEVRRYLTLIGVKTGKISRSLNKKDPESIISKLLISTKFENMINLLTHTKIRYCIYKQKKLINTLHEFGEIKLQRYKELQAEEYSHKHILKLLNINEAVFYIINHELDFNHLYERHHAEWPQDTQPTNYMIITKQAAST